jgi:hypothetical protein
MRFGLLKTILGAPHSGYEVESEFSLSGYCFVIVAVAYSSLHP